MAAVAAPYLFLLAALFIYLAIAGAIADRRK